MHGRERHEIEPPVDLPLDVAALAAREPVPLVDRDHERAAAIDRDAKQVQILLGDALACVEYRDHRARVLERLRLCTMLYFRPPRSRARAEYRPCR